MVFQALDAASLTSNTINNVNTADVQLEITLAENKIRLAAANELYSVRFDATILGNPQANPQIADNLTDNQRAFYDLLVGAGYVVSRDLETGWWLISWSPQGPETQVRIYTFRTIVAPGAIYTNTINAITAYFAALTPVVHAVVEADGFLDEADFGGTTSTFYEYTVIVDQGASTTDHSANVKSAVILQVSDYNTGNCQVYRLV